MGYFKLIPYLFLLIAVLFLIDAVTKLIDGENPFLSFLLTGMAVFMFFFRKRQYKRFENRHKK